MNVLTLATNEKVFESEEVFASTFPSLNLAQIRKLLEFFKPDKLAPEPIPPSVKRAVNGACSRNSKTSSMQLDVPPTLSLDEFDTVDSEGEGDFSEEDDILVN